MVELTFKEWVEKYKPVCYSDGFLKEFPSGEETLKTLTDENKHNIWTVLSGDGWDEIHSGTRYVNRSHYYFTEVPFEPEEWHEILVILKNDEQYESVV